MVCREGRASCPTRDILGVNQVAGTGRWTAGSSGTRCVVGGRTPDQPGLGFRGWMHGNWGVPDRNPPHHSPPTGSHASGLGTGLRVIPRATRLRQTRR